MAIKAVIFDLDGTITEPILDFNAIRDEMGLGDDTVPILEAMEEMDTQQRSRAEKILHRHEQKAIEESRLNDGTEKALEQLRTDGIHIGILTRNTRANAMAVAEKHNLIFDAIVDREAGPVKPDSFGVKQLCQDFNVPPGQTLVVGDYLFDLLCARSAGAIAVLINNHSQAEEFAEHADYVIEKLDEVLDIIKTHNHN